MSSDTSVSVKDYRKHGKTRDIVNMEGQRDEYGLTKKQRKFAENVVSGMNLSDAYRDAYDSDSMTNATIQREACRLMTNPNVSTCVESIAAERKRKSEALTVSDRDMLIRLLRSWSTGEESATSSQLRAAELLGKACGLYRDVVEDHRERPAQAIAAELESKLAALLQASVRPQPEQGSTAEPVLTPAPQDQSEPVVSH